MNQVQGKLMSNLGSLPRCVAANVQTGNPLACRVTTRTRLSFGSEKSRTTCFMYIGLAFLMTFYVCNWY